MTEADIRSYITKFEDLSEETIQAVEKMVRDKITSFVANYLPNCEWEIIHRLFLTPKEGIRWNTDYPPQLWYAFAVTIPATDTEEEKIYYYALRGSGRFRL